jgi:hypothetical protein
MKKLKIESKKLLLDKTKVTDLSATQTASVQGGDAPLLSLISCHTNHAGSACSGCDTCSPSNGGGCGSALC